MQQHSQKEQPYLDLGPSQKHTNSSSKVREDDGGFGLIGTDLSQSYKSVTAKKP